MNIIVLDQHFTECAICEKEISLSLGFALPMYEGKVDYRSKISFPVCKECFDKHDK